MGELRGAASVEGKARFTERIMRVRQHVEDFTRAVFELVTAVG